MPSADKPPPRPPRDDFECRQIFIAHQSIWDAMELWARVHGYHLSRIPDSDSTEVPTYGFMPKLPGDK